MESMESTGRSMYPRYMYLPTLAKVSTCLGRYLPIGTLLKTGSLRKEAGTSPIPDL